MPELSRHEAEAAIRRFRRIHQRHAGQHAAPISSLGDDADHFVAALTQAYARRRTGALERDLLDIQAYVDDADAALVQRYVVARPKHLTDAEADRAGAVKRMITARRQAIVADLGLRVGPGHIVYDVNPDPYHEDRTVWSPLIGGALGLGLWVVGGLAVSLVIWLAAGDIAIWLYAVTLPLGFILGAVGGRLDVEMHLLAQRAGGWAATLLQVGEILAFFGPVLAGLGFTAWLYLAFLAA